jgi:hypothetical protein
MALARDHELHHRRFGRNLGVGLVLVAFVALIFGLTIAKISGGGMVQAFDHTYRPALDPALNPALNPNPGPNLERGE